MKHQRAMLAVVTTKQVREGEAYVPGAEESMSIEGFSNATTSHPASSSQHYPPANWSLDFSNF